MPVPASPITTITADSLKKTLIESGEWWQVHSSCPFLRKNGKKLNKIVIQLLCTERKDDLITMNSVHVSNCYAHAPDLTKC